MDSNPQYPQQANNCLPSRSISHSAVAIAVIGVIFYLFQPVLITLFVSLLFAFILAPVADALERLKVPRSIAAGSAVAVVVVLFYFLIYISYDRGMVFLTELPKHAYKYRQMLLRVRQQAEAIQKTGESVLPKTSEEKTAVRVIPQTSWFEVLSRNIGSVTELLFLFSFVPFLVFFALTWQDHLQQAMVLLVRSEHRRRMHRTLHLVSTMIKSFILGTLLMGLLMGVTSTLIFGLLRVPYFYFTGFLSGFLTMVPYLGVVLAPLPPLLYGADVMSLQDTALILVCVTLLHVIAINVLYPKLLGNRLRLNPLILTIALLFWGWLWAGIGVILAIPITAAMKITFDHVPWLRPYGRLMGTGVVRKKRRRKLVSAVPEYSSEQTQFQTKKD